MSLISDTEFLIHTLRLAYLRTCDDPYGSRLINFSPSYTSNPYIVSASLADADRNPELNMPVSPQLSEEEGEQPARTRGARLNYTRTIMGRRSGAFGLRVHGRRESTSKKRLSVSSAEVHNLITPQAKALPPAPVHSDNWVKIVDPLESPQNQVQILEPAIAVEPPVAKVVQFVPKFKMAAEMEARRRRRIAARRGEQTIPISFDSSSSSSEEAIPIEVENGSDSEADLAGSESDVASVDSFDPEMRTPIDSAASLSDLTSEPSGGIPSLQSASGLSFPRPRLSPVSEHNKFSDAEEEPTRVDPGIIDIMNMKNKRPKNGEKYIPPRRLSTAAPPRTTQREQPPPLPLPATTSSSHEILFRRKPVSSSSPKTSALTAMLKSTTNSSNPFTDTYNAVSGKAAPQSTNVTIYFPHATNPAGRPMNLNVRKDATIEEVLGFALLTYWEEGWKPSLDEGLTGEDDPQWDIRLSAVGWVMRIAEDDGEVDDDFPPPDRQQNIVKVNADAYAILTATAAQVAQNQLVAAKINRPALPPKKSSSDKSGQSLLAPPLPIITGSGSIEGASVPLSTSLGPSSSHGPQIYLKVRLAEAADSVAYVTLQASTGMYMQEVLENACQRIRIKDPKNYVLIVQAGNTSVVAALDRTVASLQGQRELVLLKRSMLPQYGIRGPGKTTDPNASIFKRMSEAQPEVKLSAALDFTAAYKKYTIYRKMPMRVSRQEGTLAIDGLYVHLMPSRKAKAVFETGKTSSYHIKTIVDCQQLSKTSSGFRLILNRSGTNKRYDFEAENPRKAAEIVQAVKGLKALERTGTVKHSRSSRHGG